MILNLSTGIRHEGEQTRVTHRFRWEAGGFDWNLTYPMRLLPSPLIYLQPLVNAYALLSGHGGNHVVRASWNAEEFEPQLQWLWRDRLTAEFKDGHSKVLPDSVHLECGRTPLRPLPLQVAPDVRKYAVMYSFGKESVLTWRLLKECSITPLCFGRAQPKLWTVVDPPCFFPMTSSFQESIKGRMALGDFTQILFGPMVEHLGVTDLLMGNEYETTTLLGGNDHIACCDFQQTPTYARWVTEVFSKATARPVRMYSIINALPQLKVVEMLYTKYRKDWDSYVCACWASSKKRGVSWCGKCPKCYEISWLFEELGIPCPFKMLRSREDVIDVSGSVLFKKESDNVEYWGSKRTMGPTVQPSGFETIPDCALREKVRLLVEG